MIKKTKEELAESHRNKMRRLYRMGGEYARNKREKALEYYYNHRKAVLAQQREYRQRIKQETA